MTKYIVHYHLNEHVYETEVNASSSSAAFAWIMHLFPDAYNVYIV